MTRYDTLRTLGFTKQALAQTWSWRVPGTFGFQVMVRLTEPPEFSVYLPPQAGAWEVVLAEQDPMVALDQNRAFIREARRAYDMLSRVAGVGETSQLIQQGGENDR